MADVHIGEVLSSLLPKDDGTLLTVAIVVFCVGGVISCLIISKIDAHEKKL